MTCREKMMIEHPDDVSNEWVGGVAGCPHDVGYLQKPKWCKREKSQHCDNDLCSDCWDRLLPESEEVPHIKDSGNRREFDTGAVRDIQEGKGRCDLMPLDVIAELTNNRVLRYIYEFQFYNDTIRLEMALKEFVEQYTSWCNNISFARQGFSTMCLEVSKHFEEGAKKYGENNWQKGIPVRCYIDSAVRHYLKYLRGDTDEPHDRAFCWNIMCAIWTSHHKPELNDYTKGENV